MVAICTEPRILASVRVALIVEVLMSCLVCFLFVGAWSAPTAGDASTCGGSAVGVGESERWGSLKATLRKGDLVRLGDFLSIEIGLFRRTIGDLEVVLGGMGDGRCDLLRPGSAGEGDGVRRPH